MNKRQTPTSISLSLPGETGRIGAKLVCDHLIKFDQKNERDIL